MKKALETHEIEELLAKTRTAPEPPENLLALLKEDIPEPLPAVEERSTKPTRRPMYLIAASIFLAVVGAVVVSRVRETLPDPASAVGDDNRETPFVAVEIGVPVDEETPVAAAVEPRAESESRDERVDGGADQDVANAQVVSETPSSPVTPGKSGRSEETIAGPVSTEVPKLEADAADEMVARDRVADGKKRDLSGAGSPARSPVVPSEVEPVLKERTTRAEVFSDGRVVVQGRPPQRRVEENSAQEIRQQIPKPTVRGPEADVVFSTSVPAPPSTGGTAEPNDQPYGDMFFRSYGTNPFVDTEVDALSTFGLDVDTGAYTVARSYLERGHLPPAEAIRVEEFVNYFDYEDRAPRRGDFAVTAEGTPSPFTEGRGYQLLRFGLHGREIPVRDRKPAVLTFVIDVSGSMGRENRLGLVKRSLHLLLDELEELEYRKRGRPGDRVGLVVYGSRGDVLIEPTGDFREVRRAIDRLRTGGSTNAEEGLVLGYRLARDHFRRGAVNRVILCSDGVANVGRTGPDSILERIEREADAGVELTTVGFGMGNYNDVLMEQLADRGDGRYAYVDTYAEARRLFVHDLSGTLETIASDAKAQVEFDPGVVSLYRLLGYENRDIADERFRDDTVDAGEVGAGHQVTALYEIKLASDASPSDTVATLRLRYRSERTGRVEEEAVRLRVRDLESSWRSASPSLRLASVAAEFAEILKGSYWAKNADLGDLQRRARRLEDELRGDRDVAELADLIETATHLIGPGRPADFED